MSHLTTAVSARVRTAAVPPVRCTWKRCQPALVAAALVLAAMETLAGVVIAAAPAASETRTATTRVELHLDEPLAGRTVPWPVTTGVPFPRGALKDAQQCRLVDDQGNEQPLQTKVAATWDAGASSIRWLTVDFVAQPGRRYFLVFGPGVKRTASEALQAPLVRVSDRNNAFQVETGPLRVAFDRPGKTDDGAAAPEANGIRISLDLNADGTITDDEQVVTLPAAARYYLDHDGQPYRAAADNIAIESAGPVRACVRVDGRYVGPGGKSIVAFRTRFHCFAGLPLVKVVDEFRPIGSTRGVRFRDIAWSLQLAAPVGEPVVATDPRTLGVEPVPAVDGETPATRRHPQNPLTAEPLRIAWTPGTHSVSSYQALYRHFGNDAYEAAVVATGDYGQRRISQADRAAAWMQWADERVAVTGSLRWFWQQFPKEWEAGTNRLVLHTWSPRGGELDFGAEGIRAFLGEAGDRYLLNWQANRDASRTLDNFFYGACNRLIEEGRADGQGIRKSHEFYLHFAPAAQAAEGVQMARLAETPPVALASGQWNCSTDVFGPLAPRSRQRGQTEISADRQAPADTAAVPPKAASASSSVPYTSPFTISADEAAAIAARGEAVIDRLFQLARYGQDAFGDYGWWLFGAGPHYSYQWDPQAQRHYADPRRFDFHTYQKETQLWWCYLRSGERKFLEWALPAENHWTDIAVAHRPLEYTCDWLGGSRAEQTRHLTFVPGDWAIDSPVHYLRHHNTAEAWLRGGTQFWASYHRTLETTTAAYYLTGDERFNEVIEYWRAYFAPLAGVHSQSSGVPEHYRQQAWWDSGSTVLENGRQRPKTWAEMMRDYAPFPSGMRHQMTLWFNLSTLYEHTWDPKIGQALREYADAFLDPERPSGVWHCQQNDLPAHAPTPTMAHYWSPALWKYHRVTGDPRMETVLSRYFDACHRSDPFGLSDSIGVYSNLHPGVGYYFTGNPWHVQRALLELKALEKHAAPLARPEDLNRRIYNPYATIQCLAGIPRLLWAVEQAARTGETIEGLPPLAPQRAPLAFYKPQDKPLTVRLWGFDERVELLGPDGKPASAQVESQQSPSPVQPFDRVMPQFAAWWHDVTVPASEPRGWYVLAPQLELGVLASSSPRPTLCHAASPIHLESGATCWIAWPAGATALQLDSALWRAGTTEVVGLEIVTADGHPLRLAADRSIPGRLVATLADDGNADQPAIISICNTGERGTWFRMADGTQPSGQPSSAGWAVFANLRSAAAVLDEGPSSAATTAALARMRTVAPPGAAAERFVPGRHGQAVLITGGRKLILPDHLTGPDGTPKKLFDLEQGTLEFFVQKLWDERVMPVRQGPLLNNGLVHGFSPWPLPLGEWAHVAVVWRPFRRDPSQVCVHVYVNGLDRANYRSTWWQGYGNRPYSLPKGRPWLEGFVAQALGGGAFALDEVRLSRSPRYADLEVEFGHRQTFNPVRFDPPDRPLPADEATSLLYRFDGTLESEPLKDGQRLTGRWE